MKPFFSIMCSWVVIAVGCDKPSHPPVFQSSSVSSDLPESTALDARDAKEGLGTARLTEAARLDTTTCHPHEIFGTEVAICGETLVACSLGYKDPTRSSGRAVVFEMSSADEWRPSAELIRPNGKRYGRLGCAVAMGEAFIAVGAEHESNGAGGVYIFNRQADGQWILAQRLQASDSHDNQLFGCALAYSDELLVVGANQDNMAGSDAGAAFVFKRQPDGLWQESAKLTSNDLTAGDQFGAAVSTSNGTVVVGSRHNDDNTGSAYVFRVLEGATWTQVAKLKSDLPTPFAQFANCVAIDNNVIAVGEWLRADQGQNAGAAHLFELDADMNCRRSGRLSPRAPSQLLRFGYSIALCGSHLLIGTLPEHDCRSAARAYFFRARAGGIWAEVGLMEDPSRSKLSHFGSAVALSENWAVIGDETHNLETGTGYLFKLSNLPNVP